MKDFFSFDNLGGEYPLLSDDIRRGTPAAVFGVSDPHKYLIAALIPRRFVYIAADALAAKRAFDAIAALSGKKCALLCAKDEVLTYRKALSRDSLFRRLTALWEWQSGADVLVCDVEAAIQLLPRKVPVFTLKAGDETELSGLISDLVRAGYTREYSVDAKGAFAVRGDILDIWPINCEHPVRVDFFGDEVESIKPYDEITSERLPLCDRLDIVSATDVVVGDGDEQEVRRTLAEELKKAPSASAYARMKSIADDILSGESISTDYVLPLLSSSCDLFSLLDDETLLLFDECKLVHDKLDGLYKEHGERYLVLRGGGEAMSFSLRQYVERDDFFSNVLSFRALALQTFAGNAYFFNPLKIYNFTATPVARYLNSLPDLISDLKAWMKTGYRVILWCGTQPRAEKMREELSGNYFPVAPLAPSLSAMKGISVLDETLAHGLILHECRLVLVGTGDLYTKAAEQKRIRKRRGDLFVAPEIGDYAVHESYGVGRITGTKKIETTDGTKEYIALEYKDGDTLYVPVEQMDTLSKYMGGDNPTLSKIGGGEFERVKARVRASLKKMAFDLKQLYAERQERRGYVFPEYREMMEEFEAAFPYEETPDQLSSIAEIKADMCSDKVMDRLLCGDVGFGKTEVALRAAYLCILAGKQAAIMCPSTVLSEQHYRTAVERMKDFGVRIAVLNRFRTGKEQDKALKGLADGTVDLIIGTHRLLSSDVKFHDLGLLILDEEQRFGVEHKEKIKNLKRNVDCLTMTATPIPRTLHMSLSGIRDISTIQTPPHARLPVQTYVAEETETLIRDACVREIARGGQVFVLYNRVESIHTFAKKVADIVPEARVCAAHGRMDKSVLEANVFGFYRGEYDILVTTTIIENGIDLPNANTIIVIDADRLGISQLYQLRGRVGRSSRLAHAYFTYKPERVMTQNAAERLKAIMQFTELGSGYKIAMRDLEIRGAGNVLGAEQHGHMDKVGYELYAKMLKEELTGVKQESCDLDIKATAFIPESYVESNAGRLDCYKQIAEIRSPADYKRVCTSMEETYGAMPPETLNLLVIAVLKSYAPQFGVRKISVNHKGGALEFADLKALGDNRIGAAMDKYARYVSLDMTSAPVLRFAPCADGGQTMVLMTKFLKFASTFA